MLLNLKTYAKKTTINYIVIGIIIAVQVLITSSSALYDLLMQNSSFSYSDFSGNILVLLTMGFGSLAISQAIVLIAATFDFNKLFGLSNQKSIKGTILFVMMSSAILSILYILLNGLGYTLSNQMPELIFGMNWVSFTQLHLKFILIFLVFLMLYGLNMWLTVGYKKHGVLSGLTRTFIAVTYLINHGNYIATYVEWGQNAAINITVLLIISILTISSTYFEMLTYERR
ncbi:MAG: hypothetical protein JEZ08_19915 [Clostridiales bacterium]|nr:hypothetical protein [Clostridiales bacterium]